MKRTGRIKPKPSERRDAEREALTAAREVVYRRSRGRCEVCGGVGSEFSHRRTRAVRGEHAHAAENALWACRTCHDRMHRNPEVARANGWHVSRYVEDPGTVPVWLPPRSGWFLLGRDGSLTPSGGPDGPEA